MTKKKVGFTKKSYWLLLFLFQLVNQPNIQLQL